MARLSRFDLGNLDWQARHLGVESAQRPTRDDMERLFASYHPLQRPTLKQFAKLWAIAEWAWEESHSRSRN